MLAAFPGISHITLVTYFIVRIKMKKFSARCTHWLNLCIWEKEDGTCTRETTNTYEVQKQPEDALLAVITRIQCVLTSTVTSLHS